MDKTYIKSEKALREFDAGNRTLSIKQRQLLIMVDGNRSASQLIQIFDRFDAGQMLLDLEKLGYLLDKKAVSVNVATTLNKPNETGDELDNLGQEHLAFIKAFLVDELQKYAGILGRDLIQKIENVQLSKDLPPYISRWHITIRESQVGRMQADALIGQLHHLIANPPEVMPSELAS